MSLAVGVKWILDFSFSSVLFLVRVWVRIDFASGAQFLKVLPNLKFGGKGYVQASYP